MKSEFPISTNDAEVVIFIYLQNLNLFLRRLEGKQFV